MNDLLEQKVTARSLVDVVAERLEAAIISGALEPGAKLSEQALAASLGVSRGPLREAIRRLEGRKLLERTPNIGVRVAALSLADLNQMLQIRERLEGLACWLAAQTMSDQEIAELSAHVGEQAPPDPSHYEIREDFAFHARIAAGSRNERLRQMLSNDLFSIFQLYSDRLGGRRDRGEKVHAEHQAIVAAIAGRDSDAAEAAMRLHLRNAWRHIEEQLAAQEEAPAAAPARRRVGTLD